MEEQLPELQQPMLEQLLLRHHVFVRSARDAAHQALFFLEMLHPTTSRSANQAIEDHWETALHQVMAIIRGVQVPSLTQRVASALAGLDDEGDLSIPEETRAGMSRASEIAGAWEELRDALAWDRARDNFPLEKIPELRQAIIRFLDDSRTEGTAGAFIKHYFSDGFRWLARHLTVFLATALLLWVSLGVEAVSGLLYNEGWKRLLVFLVVLPLPFYGHRLVDLFMRKGDTVFRLSIGSRPFWSFDPLVIGPGRLIRRWPEGSPLLRAIAQSQLMKVGLYIGASLLAVSAIYGVRLWFEIDSTLTVPCILVIFYLILLLANQLDFWDFLFSQPVRFTSLLVAIGCLIGLRAGAARHTFILVFCCAALILACLGFLSKRRRRPFVVAAVIALVVAGINIKGWDTDRKRIWKTDSGQRIERLTLEEWPHQGEGPVVVMAASGGGSRAAVYAGLTLEKLYDLDGNATPHAEEFREIADHLQAISSVSGGSLANAAYVARLLEAHKTGREPELSGMVDALNDDFLFPTLKGAVVPGLSRGTSIEDAWRWGRVGLGESSLWDLAECWRNTQHESTPPFPIPLFNTSTLEGHDLVISPMAAELFTNKGMHNEAGSTDNLYDRARELGDPTWVYYRHGVYGLEHLLPEQDLKLSSAVLASANFPFGFPVVKVRPAGPLYFSPNPDPGLVKLTDGGALSNSGMWSLFNLLINKRGDLFDRGVLLIVVEASKMPHYESMESTFNRLLGTIGDQGPIGRNLHERMFDVLEKEYWDPEKNRGRFASVQIDLTPIESKNIMTTWALDKSSFDRLTKVFERRWDEESPSLAAKWRCLKEEGESCTGIELVDRRRLPMD